MSNKIIVSIIMPTLNSEKTIKIALDSIRRQSFPQYNIEILVCDGGSTDKTIEIAKKFGAKIIDNYRVQPECAKHEGLMAMKGKYAIFLDSDEAFYDDLSISKRVGLMEDFPDNYIVLTDGYLNPKGYSKINDYINVFSDPFSFFMYKQHSVYGSFLKNWKKFNRIGETTNGYIYDMSKIQNFTPLVDFCAGNMVNKKFIDENLFNELNDVSIIPNLFSLVSDKTKKTGIVKGSPIYHYSPDTFIRYIRKLRWRVIMNLFYIDLAGAGFGNRTKSDNKFSFFSIKKFFFIPYSLTIILPFTESIFYTLKYKKLILLLHPIFSFYVGFNIIKFSILKFLGKKPILPTYGNK